MQKFLHLLSIVVVAIVGLCFVVLQPFPVLHDFPEWMYQGWLAHHLLFGNDSSVLNLFSLAQYPVPNSVTQFAIAVLNTVTTPIVAGKVWLTIYLLYASILWWGLSRQLSRDQTRDQTRNQNHRYDGAINLVLTMTFTLGPGFWNGYANFQFALLFLGSYLLLMRLRRDGVVAHLLLSLLIFFSHAAVFIAFAGLVAVRVLFKRLSLRYFASVVPSLVLFAWYLLATVRVDRIGELNTFGLFEWMQYKVYTVAKQGYFHNFILADGSSLLGNAHPLYLFGFGLNLGVALIIITWLLYQSFYLLRSADVFAFANRHRHPVTEQTIKTVSCNRVSLVSLLALLLLFLVAGKDNFGVVNLGERFLIAALLLALVQLQCHRLLWNFWVTLVVIGALYTMIAVVKVSMYPVEKYAVLRSTDSSTLGGAIDDIYANSRHKYFNHRLYIYADHGIWLDQPGTDLLPLKHITSFVVPK